MNYTDKQIIQALEDAVICVGQAPFVEKVAKGEQLKSDIIDLINRLEADVVEVKHGEWKCINNQHNYYEYHCSLCDRVERQEEPYCHCGAKMDEEKKDKE